MVITIYEHYLYNISSFFQEKRKTRNNFHKRNTQVTEKEKKRWRQDIINKKGTNRKKKKK